MKSNASIVVIGGGVAGLSAAVRLTAAGHRVILLERGQRLGGRASSFTDPTTGDVVDNGQHLMMGCYHETLAYLDIIGARDAVRIQPKLSIAFGNVATGDRATLSAASFLPAPLHVFAGLLRFPWLNAKDKLSLFTMGQELLWSAPWKEFALQNMTVDHWLKELGQSEEARRVLWDVIALGSLNDAPATVSALPFFRVLRAAFFGARSNASMIIPRVGLTDLLATPAKDLIERHGGSVRLTTPALQLEQDANNRITGVNVGTEVIPASAVISAVPHHAIRDLVQDPAIAPEGHRLQSSPIVTVYFWFERPVMDAQFMALLGGHFQWVFNRSAMTGSGSGRQCIACLISGAEREAEMDKSDLVSIALRDLGKLLPGVLTTPVVHTLAIKEMRATFAPRPGTEAKRPEVRTSVPNLFLAGDWTATGLPATIEGAILSGRKAADAALQLM